MDFIHDNYKNSDEDDGRDSKGNRFVVYYADLNLVDDGSFKASVFLKEEFHFSREF